MSDLKKITEQLRTQDNRCTNLPMFCVQEKKREYGFDPQWSDNCVWIDTVSGDYGVSETERDGWEKTGYKDFWITVMVCFTEQGCMDYLSVNGHHHGETRIYVESFYRCEEMIKVREFLMNHLESKCKWTEDDTCDFWETACGQLFEFNDGGPVENMFKFCPHCGKPLDEHKSEDNVGVEQ